MYLFDAFELPIPSATPHNIDDGTDFAEPSIAQHEALQPGAAQWETGRMADLLGTMHGLDHPGRPLLRTSRTFSCNPRGFQYE